MIIRVAVLKGGLSAEREVSLVSGLEIAKALRSEGFAVTEIDANINLWEQLHAANPDVIVNALHGEWGENGKVQGILELYGKPYTHSGVTASRLAMDKHRAKAVLRDAGIHVPDGILIKRSELQHTHPMKPPYVAKPNGQGSSIGVYIVEEGTDAPPVEIQKDDAMGETVVVEKYIPGRELTVSVMDGRALAVTEILPNSDWYDYEAKYADGASEHILPADIPDEATALCFDWALKAHYALGCSGITRADFRFNDTNYRLTDVVNKLVMLEVNTQPGMTPTSLVPEQAAHVGMSFRQLCRWMVEDATWPRMEALRERIP